MPSRVAWSSTVTPNGCRRYAAPPGFDPPRNADLAQGTVSGNAELDGLDIVVDVPCGHGGIGVQAGCPGGLVIDRSYGRDESASMRHASMITLERHRVVI